VNRVLEMQCTICTEPITHAATLKCGHMLCVNCIESNKIEKCPWCQGPLQVKVVSVLACVSVDRRVPIAEDMQRRDRTEQAAQSAAQRNTARNANDEAIDEVLIQAGVEDPAAYRATLRRQGRQRNRIRRNYGNQPDEEPTSPRRTGSPSPGPSARRRSPVPGPSNGTRRSVSNLSVLNRIDQQMDELFGAEPQEIRSQPPPSALATEDANEQRTYSHSQDTTQRRLRQEAAARTLSQRRSASGMVYSQGHDDESEDEEDVFEPVRPSKRGRRRK
jgi:hypothetical protein